MAIQSEIAWTDSTFNPWIGCQHVSPGCDHCYAEEMAMRYRWADWGPKMKRHRTAESTWHQPRRWNAKASEFQYRHGHRQRVFCASLCDWLDNQVPPEWRRDLLALIDDTPQLDWLLLTKRPENARKLVPPAWWGRKNVWFGITAEDQMRFDHRWPIARQVPARIHFVSYEPAIGPLDLAGCGAPPDWIIFGGESGEQARRADPQWGLDMITQCRALGIAPFIKQLGRRPAGLKLKDFKGGKMHEWATELRVREFPR